MRNAKIKFMLVGIFTMLTVTLLSISCKVEDAAVKEWTVTIDPNGMSLSGTLKVTVKDGEKATLPSDIAPPTDYEIAYYSTVKDDYSKVFDFANTAVTSDITVYPHYRLQLSKVLKNIAGNWVDISPSKNFQNKYLYKISADNSLNGIFRAYPTSGGGSNIDLLDTNNLTVRNALIQLPVLPKNDTNPFGENTNNTIVSGYTLYCMYFEPLVLNYESNSSDKIFVNNVTFFEVLGQKYSIKNYDATSMIIGFYTNTDLNTTGEITLQKVN